MSPISSPASCYRHHLYLSLSSGSLLLVFFPFHGFFALFHVSLFHPRCFPLVPIVCPSRSAVRFLFLTYASYYAVAIISRLARAERVTHRYSNECFVFMSINPAIINVPLTRGRKEKKAIKQSNSFLHLMSA